MSKNSIMLAGLLLLGSAATSQAHPLDTPDIVYIDGLPCNSACQSYMAWSRRRTPFTSEHATGEATPADVEVPAVKPAHANPAPRQAKSAVSRVAAVHKDSSKPAKPRVAKQAAVLPAQVTMPPAEITTLRPAPDVAGKAEPAPTDVAALASPDAAPAAAKVRTLQKQVAAATALAEQVTAASATPRPEAESSVTEAKAGEPDSTAPTTASKPDNRVALLMTRAEITSISDLAGKDIAIEDQQSASSASIRVAIASAGAAEVKLNEGPVKAIDRLVGGEVQAAVLTLVSAEAAAWFPEVPGYRIFRIPLSSGSSKAAL